MQRKPSPDSTIGSATPREGVRVRVERVEKYFDHYDARQSRNPLVAAFPPLNEEAVVALMTNDISFDPLQRTHPAYARVGYAMQLADFFNPLDEQVEFCARLWEVVKKCYSGRTLGNSDQPGFTALMRKISQGDLPSFADDVVADATMSPVLIGTPGSGKSTSVKAFFRHLNKDLLYHPEHNIYQALAVFVQAPKKGSALSLSRQVFDNLMMKARAIPGPVPYSTGRRPKSTEDYIAAVVTLVEKLHLGLLVLDELQHMFNASGVPDEESMKFLTGVINRLGIPILMIGTWKCVPLLGLEARLGRRATSPADFIFHRLQRGDDWSAFLELLFAKQYVATPVALDAEMAEVFYDLTQGIQDIAVKLYIACQCEAIRDGSERLSVDLVRSVAGPLLSRMAPSLRQIRNGRRDDDPVLWDLDPSDLGNHLKSVAARCATEVSRRSEKKAAESTQRLLATSTAAACLENLGVASADDASELASAAANESPAAGAAELVAKVLKQTTPKGPKPSRATSDAKQAAVRAEFERLDDADVRKVVYLSAADGAPTDAALTAAGHLCPLHMDLAF